MVCGKFLVNMENYYKSKIFEIDDNKKISVIMGIYNCESTLSFAIDSILEQTYKNWELIMCDDCSTDSTYVIANTYKIKYPDKIILLKNEANLKLSYSLNCCLKYATGYYIARMDADDISSPDRFLKQVDFLKTHSEYDLVSTGMTPFDEKFIYKPRILKKIPDKYDLVKSSCFSHATIMTTKKVFDLLGGYRVSKMTSRSQDYDLWFRFFYNGLKGYNMQESLYYVREDKKAFGRRKWWVRWNNMKIKYYGFKLLQFPIWYYPYIVTPLYKMIVPPSLVYLYRNKQRGKIINGSL